MQATVRGFAEPDGTGSVFLDDGTVCEFGPEVFAASGLRLLRRGQRVAIRRNDSGVITALALATLPMPEDTEGAAGPAGQTGTDLAAGPDHDPGRER
jgi:hypothetical protein